MGMPKYPSEVRFFANPTGINMAVNGATNNVSFDLTAPEGTMFEVWNIKFCFISTWNKEAYTTYNKFMNQNALTNGILIQDTKDGQVTFEATIKTNTDLIILPVAEWKIPFRTDQIACIELSFDFSPYTSLILDSGMGDFNRIKIRDNLSTLYNFTASARGVIYLT